MRQPSEPAGPSSEPAVPVSLDPAALEARWYAVWTRSHCEQLVLDQLAARGFETFLPCAFAWVRHAVGRRRTRAPLFPGYLFVRRRMDRDSHVEILKAHGAVRVLGERWDRLSVIPDDEIDAVRRAVSSGVPVYPHVALVEGDRVRITGGPLMGLQGIFLRGRPQKGLLVISVSLLRRGVAVEVDCTLVEAV